MKELANYAKQHVPKEHPKVKNLKRIMKIFLFIFFYKG